ncbi:MAG: hypothetical protein E6R09_07760, partial [Rhodocyclaceae bacterium]
MPPSGRCCRDRRATRKRRGADMTDFADSSPFDPEWEARIDDAANEYFGDKPSSRPSDLTWCLRFVPPGARDEVVIEVRGRNRRAAEREALRSLKAKGLSSQVGTFKDACAVFEIDPSDLRQQHNTDTALPTLDLVAMSKTRAKPTEFVIERIAPKGEVTLFTGAGSAGKSLLSQQLATATAAGIGCLGLTLTPTTAHYITCEDGADQVHFRQERLCEALGIPMASLAGKLHLTSLRGELGNELATFGSDGKIIPTDTYH